MVKEIGNGDINGFEFELEKFGIIVVVAVDEKLLLFDGFEEGFIKFVIFNKSVKLFPKISPVLFDGAFIGICCWGLGESCEVVETTVLTNGICILFAKLLPYLEEINEGFAIVLNFEVVDVEKSFRATFCCWGEGIAPKFEY